MQARVNAMLASEIQGQFFANGIARQQPDSQSTQPYFFAHSLGLRIISGFAKRKQHTGVRVKPNLLFILVEYTKESLLEGSNMLTFI